MSTSQQQQHDIASRVKENKGAVCMGDRMLECVRVADGVCVCVCAVSGPAAVPRFASFYHTYSDNTNAERSAHRDAQCC